MKKNNTPPSSTDPFSELGNWEEMYQIDKAIPLEEQKRYYVSSQAMRRNPKQFSTEELNDIESLLYKKEMGENWHRNQLVKLAVSGQIESYRLLEDFLMVSPPKLSNWATLAEFDAQTIIRAGLSDQTQITVISSGLGGRSGLMRFMLLCFTRNWQTFEPYQKELTIKEFSYAVNKNKGQVENYDVGDNYIRMTILFPLGNIPDPIIKKAIFICNEFGEFLNPDSLLVTNANKIEDKDIERLKSIKITSGPGSGRENPI